MRNLCTAYSVFTQNKKTFPTTWRSWPSNYRIRREVPFIPLYASLIICEIYLIVLQPHFSQNLPHGLYNSSVNHERNSAFAGKLSSSNPRKALEKDHFVVQEIGWLRCYLFPNQSIVQSLRLFNNQAEFGNYFLHLLLPYLPGVDISISTVFAYVLRPEDRQTIISSEGISSERCQEVRLGIFFTGSLLPVWYHTCIITPSSWNLQTLGKGQGKSVKCEGENTVVLKRVR